MKVSRKEVEDSARKSCIGHGKKREVKVLKEHWNERIDMIHTAIERGEYKTFIHYKRLEKINKNGKKRKIDSPDLNTRILQNVFIGKIFPLYKAQDADVSYNCKKGYGLNAKAKKKSFIHKMKHLYYDMRNLSWCACIDQRKCYEHVSEKVIRRSLKRLTRDKKLVQFGIDVSMLNGKLPIGTPASPLLHHIVMLEYDSWAKREFLFVARYADNVIIACESKQEAHAAMWRTRMKWWYELGIRANRKESRIVSLDKIGTDICGVVYKRNPQTDVASHNKGYARIRRITADSARRATIKNWACYYGQMKGLDCYSLIKKIENRNMKLSKLTEKLKIDRNLDAPHVEMRDIEGVLITVLDYEIRKNGRGVDNWVKLLISYKEEDENGKVRDVVREVHGDYAGIHKFLRVVENEYDKKEFLPIEDAVIVNECGYIFADSTNQIKYIEEYDSKKIC